MENSNNVPTAQEPSEMGKGPFFNAAGQAAAHATLTISTRDDKCYRISHILHSAGGRKWPSAVTALGTPKIYIAHVGPTTLYVGITMGSIPTRLTRAQQSK